MSLVDVMIPLVGGMLALSHPKLLLKKDTPPDQVEAKVRMLRRAGLTLIGVAVFFALMAIDRTRKLARTTSQPARPGSPSMLTAFLSRT